MGIGVVIVHFGSPETTLRCVASVLEDPSPAVRTVVVVDNQGSLSHKELPAEVGLLHSSANRGFGAGVNQGVRELERDSPWAGYLALNNDVELAPGFLGAAIRALGPGVGAAAGPIYLDRERRQVWYSGGGINFVTGTVWQSTNEGQASRRRPVGFLPAAAMVVAREAWEEIGGFDERYFLYNEDIDLCLRLRRRGWELMFEPEMATVHHLGSATGSRDRSPVYLEHLTRGRLLPFRPWLYRVYLGGLHTAYNGLRCVVLLVRRGRRAMPSVRALARGHRAALADLFKPARR